MRVLVTGGSGFIGTNLIGALIDQGADVRNLDIQTPLNSDQEALWQPVGYAKIA